MIWSQCKLFYWLDILLNQKIIKLSREWQFFTLPYAHYKNTLLCINICFDYRRSSTILVLIIFRIMNIFLYFLQLQVSIWMKILRTRLCTFIKIKLMSFSDVSYWRSFSNLDPLIVLFTVSVSSTQLFCHGHIEFDMILE